MAKSLSDFNLKAGDKFKKGEMILILLRMEKGKAVLHRSYNGISRILEVVNIAQLKNCPKIYKKLEATVC